MPTYEYACTGCGTFEFLRPIAERDRDTACPGCGAPAARVVVGGAHLVRTDAATRRLIGSHERAAADGSYRRMRHPAACGCCARR